MKQMIIVFTVALMLLGSNAPAACPDNVGIFSTLHGTLLPGRASEAWCGAGGAPFGPGQVGNTSNAESWDGATLGTQWAISGMSIDAGGAVLVSDTVNGDGNGTRTYETSYEGGEFWLAGSGPWTDGDVELSGSVYDFAVVTTIYFVSGNPVSQVSNITFNGDFSDCSGNNNCLVEFAIANAILAWNSDMAGPMPADYPGFLCDATLGELFQNNDVTIGLHCVVATDQMSFSNVKGMYR